MDDLTTSASQSTYYSASEIALPQTRIAPPPVPVKTAAPALPDYLADTYHWCYLHPRHVQWLDREIVVRTILWQQHNKLQKLAFEELEAGQSVLQTAAVYGTFSVNLARHLGEYGHLDVVDVAEVQVKNARRKLLPYPWARVHQGDVMELDDHPYDAVCCYFLLHEVPDEFKHRLVNVALSKIRPGGKAVFVDYHKPVWWHPLKLITSIVFDTLEPFAKGMWRNEIRDFADEPERFTWRKQPHFGKLFQKVVATRNS